MTFKTGDRVRNTRTGETGTIAESYNGKPAPAGYQAVIYDEDPNVWEVPAVRLELIGEEENDPQDKPGDEDYIPPCSCRLAPVHTTDIDPPGMILDRDCPVHGDEGPDPDAQRDDRMERIGR